MRAGWVAGGVRAELLLRHRVGSEHAATIAVRPTLADALRSLASTIYGERVHESDTLAQAERALAATVLWHLRILAGWLPAEAGEPMRALAGRFEIVNIRERVAAITRDFAAPPPFELGGLSTAWRAVDQARDLPDIRRAIARSAWGDPGYDEPQGLLRGLSDRWQQRLLAALPETAPWIELASRASKGPPESAWRAQLEWWRVVESDAQRLRRGQGDRERLLAAVALLAVDARRVARALALCARSLGADSEEYAQTFAEPPASVRRLRAPDTSHIGGLAGATA